MLTAYFVACLFCPTLLSPGRENEDDKYQLEKRTALVSDQLLLQHTEDFDLDWKAIVQDGMSEEDATSMKVVAAKGIQAGCQNIDHHISSILSELAMVHKKAAFVCFQCAVQNTRKDIQIKSGKKSSKSNIAGRTKKNAAFTSSRRTST